VSVVIWLAAAFGAAATVVASVNGIAGMLHERKDVRRFAAMQQHIEDHVATTLLEHVNAQHRSREGT
jgi:NAD/NADP transhydrogenase alpha subunit